MNDMLDQLCFASAEFAYFLINVACSTKEDLFLIGLMQMIKEENQICTVIEGSNHLNFQLFTELETLKQKYEEQMKEIQSNPTHQDLQTIYKRMQTIYEFPIIHEQMIAIKEKRELQTQQHKSETPTKMDSS
jgi:hypothetical protein